MRGEESIIFVEFRHLFPVETEFVRCMYKTPASLDLFGVLTPHRARFTAFYFIFCKGVLPCI